MIDSVDINKYIGIGVVDSEPRVKFISSSDSYLIEFLLAIKVGAEEELQDSITIKHPVFIRNERLALFLKDTLKQGMRIYLEGRLLPYQPRPDNKKGTTKTDEFKQIQYRIEAFEVLMIDPIEKTKYPEGIKKIR